MVEISDFSPSQHENPFLSFTFSAQCYQETGLYPIQITQYILVSDLGVNFTRRPEPVKLNVVSGVSPG